MSAKTELEQKLIDLLRGVAPGQYMSTVRIARSLYDATDVHARNATRILVLRLRRKGVEVDSKLHHGYAIRNDAVCTNCNGTGYLTRT